MTATLQQFIDGFARARVLVVGDIMLDRFVYGRVLRISPEGPIPVLAIEQEIVMPGGAANVARNISSLGGTAIVVGLHGDDSAGRTLANLLATEPQIEADLVTSKLRRTTEKIRYVASGQQLLRADIDDVRLAPQDDVLLMQAFERRLPDADIVVLSDYGKGVLSAALVAAMIAATRKAGKPVIADPKHPDAGRYNGATVLTPNSAEAQEMTRVGVQDDAKAEEAANVILSKAANLESVLITRGSHGMTLGVRGGATMHIPTAAREVFDVSGAGDTVVATLSLAIAAGAELATAAQMANLAAGVAVGKVGTACVSGDELLMADQASRILTAEAKVMSLKQILDDVARWRRRGERVGFTNGCFDLIHPGHVSLLERAKRECTRLIVGLNTDKSVVGLKGPNRPIQDEMARAIVLASLSSVDAVVMFDAETPIDLIRATRPDVLIKGADYSVDQVVGADFVQSYGGKVVLAALTPGMSTTGIIARFAQEDK